MPLMAQERDVVAQQGRQGNWDAARRDLETQVCARQCMQREARVEDTC